MTNEEILENVYNNTITYNPVIAWMDAIKAMQQAREEAVKEYASQKQGYSEEQVNKSWEILQNLYHFEGYFGSDNWTVIEREFSKILFTLPTQETSQQEKSEWISVANKLPIYYNNVLVKIANNEMFCAHRVSDGDKSYYVISGTDNLLMNITHWMPLPNSPKQ